MDVMSLFSFFKTSREETALILEIGSGSIGGAIVVFSNSQKPKIIFSTRKQITFQESLPLASLLPKMEMALTDVLQQISLFGRSNPANAEKLKKIQKSNFILSAPWSLTQTKIVDYEPGTEFYSDKKFLSSIYEKQEEMVLAESRKILDGLGSDIKIIENKTIQMRMNGYRVNNVLNRKAKSLTMATVVTSAPVKALDLLTTVTQKHFPAVESQFYSFGLSSFTVARDFYPDKESFIFLDMGSEITDLELVRDEVLMAGASFNFGRNHFVRNLASDLKVTVEEAFSLISIYNSKNLDDAFTARVEKSLDQTMSKWQVEMSDTLEKLSKEIYVPRTIFKITNDDFGYYFANKLKDITFSQMGFSNDTFNVVVFDKNVVSKSCDVGVGVKADVFIYVNCLFLNKLYNLNK